MNAGPDREIVFVGSSLRDLSAFPLAVKKVMGHALRLAQRGERHPDARLMVGFRGARVMEIPDDHDGDTYRTMYTATLGNTVYVLHAFKKKSTSGIKTPQHDIATIELRLKRAKELHAERERAGTEG